MQQMQAMMAPQMSAAGGATTEAPGQTVGVSPDPAAELAKGKTVVRNIDWIGGMPRVSPAGTPAFDQAMARLAAAMAQAGASYRVDLYLDRRYDDVVVKSLGAERLATVQAALAAGLPAGQPPRPSSSARPRRTRIPGSRSCGGSSYPSGRRGGGRCRQPGTPRARNTPPGLHRPPAGRSSRRRPTIRLPPGPRSSPAAGQILEPQETVMNRVLARAAALALATSLAGATSALAQKLTISPTIGVYIPTTELIKAANGEEFKQEVGLAVGGRLGVNISPRFGILTSVTYVPSDLKIDLATGKQAKNKANLLFGSARATLYVLPITAPVWFSVNGGGSYIRRSGDAYADASDKDDIGGVVGATLGLPPRRHAQLLCGRGRLHLRHPDRRGRRSRPTRRRRTTCTSRSGSACRSGADEPIGWHGARG